jgi:uncharacterized protein YdcH (DUF465 family)
MLPKSAISHSAYGRTRFRLASKRREDAFFARIAERLQQLDGVKRVEVNPATGSVLVHHQLPLAELTRQAQQQSLFRVDDAPAERLSDSVRRQFSILDGEISRLTNSRLDLQDLALLLLIIVGLRQLAAGQFAVPAVSAFWYAAALLTGKDK